MQQSDVLIVGGGHSGAQAALALRQCGFAGSVTLLSRESEPPYERPPLSKEYLAREKPFERLYIRPLQLWADKQIALELGRTVTAVDPASKTLTIADGATLGYSRLIWATGGDPRRLECEGGDQAGVHKDYVPGRKLVEAGSAPDLGPLADPAWALKELV